MTPSYPAVVELIRQLDQEKIDTLTKRVEDLRNQNQELKDNILKSENDTHEFVAYFQKEIETKDKTISNLNDEIIRKESELRVAVKCVQEKAQRELTDANDKMEALKKRLSARISVLEGDLSTLVRFRELKRSHEKAMEDMTAEMEAKERAHAQEINSLERKFLTEKSAMEKDMDRVIDGIKRQSKIEAEGNLDAEAKRIAGLNKRMTKDLRFQTQMTTELQAYSKSLEGRTTNNAREIAILSERDQEYARQGQAKNRELKRLRTEVAALNKALFDEVSKGERERDRTNQKVSRELEERTLDVAGLRQLLALKNRELRQLRRLSQYILDQRNEVETFFLESLEEVKRNIVDHRQKEYQGAFADHNMRVQDAGKHRTKLPKLRSNGDFMALESGPRSSLPTNPETKVDISRLTWEDKERVLRLLFAKINNIQGSVEATPHHTLETSTSIDLSVRDDAMPQESEEEHLPHTFVTQGNGDGGGSSRGKSRSKACRKHMI